MKKENGLSMRALIIIVVLLGIVIFLGFRYVKNYINNEKDEDIKTIMLLIQGKVTEIGNKHTVDEETNSLVGIKLDFENNNEEYNIPEELMNILKNREEAELYILTQDDINNMQIKDVTVDSDVFYIVDYSTNEVFYSIGINGKYSLSELEEKEEIEDNITNEENTEIQENTENNETESNNV